MRSEEVLNLGSRRRIYEYVVQRPGAHLRQVARALNLPLGTALYHLEYLRTNEMVAVRRDGRYKRFFAGDDIGRRDKDYISAFHHTVPRKIVSALLSHGPGTQRELCKRVGVSRSTLSFHVNALVQKEMLRRIERWPENLYEVVEPEIASRILNNVSFESQPGSLVGIVHERPQAALAP